MENRYVNGYLMSPHVVSALIYLGKVGVLSSSDWYNLFCTNNDRRWQERQLVYLVNNGYIKKHPAESLKSKWILAEQGKSFLNARKWSIVNPVHAHHVDHDEFVARSIYGLYKTSYIRLWKVERELKVLNQKDYLLSNKDGNTKYPDAIFKIKLPDGLRTIAIEYERNGKSESRYRSILCNYSNLTTISLVIFICEEDRYARILKRALKNMGKFDLLKDRLATTDTKNWRNSPLEAPLEMSRGGFTLKNFCQVFDDAA